MALQLPPGMSLSDIPAGTPPPGVVPNFAHPSATLQPTLIGVTVTFMVLGLFFAAMNMIQHRRDMRAADWIIVAACVITVGYSALVISYSYVAVHQWEVNLATLNNPRLLKLELAQDIFTVVSVFVAKCAIIMLYLQIFDIRRPLRIACYIGFFINLCAYLPQVVAAPIFCAAHPGEQWNLLIGQRCSKDLPVGIARSAVGTLLDIYLFILPIVPVTQLKLSLKRKIAVLAVFGTAFLGVVSSVLSLAFVVKAYLSADNLWYAAIVELCNIIEVWIAIIVASMPGFAVAMKTSLFESGFVERITTTVNSLLGSGSRAVSTRSRSSRRNADTTGQSNPTSGYELQYQSDRSVDSRSHGIGKTVELEQSYEHV